MTYDYSFSERIQGRRVKRKKKKNERSLYK